MTFSVIVHSTSGQFEAAVLGAPEVNAIASTRDEALTALESAIEKRVQQGELVNLMVGRKGIAAFAGKYHDDPTLQDICDEAYRERDRDRDARE